MDPYNIAICFGPTLVPIPTDRDQVRPAYRKPYLINSQFNNVIFLSGPISESCQRAYQKLHHIPWGLTSQCYSCLTSPFITIDTHNQIISKEVATVHKNFDRNTRSSSSSLSSSPPSSSLVIDRISFRMMARERSMRNTYPVSPMLSSECFQQ